MIGELALLFGVMIGLLLLGLPIFFAIGAAGAAYAVVFAPKVPLMVIGQRFVNGLDSYDFAAIPFFFLAGEIMNRGGISARLLRFARAAIGHIRGGLSHVNVLASMVFAGVSGSAAADASAIGSVMIPAMKREGYPAAYAASVTAASATIGPMIPPSIPLVIYALFAQQSVGQMFLAGVLPGLGMGLLLLGASIWISRRRGYPSRPWQGWGELVRAGLKRLAGRAQAFSAGGCADLGLNGRKVRLQVRVGEPFELEALGPVVQRLGDGQVVQRSVDLACASHAASLDVGHLRRTQRRCQAAVPVLLSHLGEGVVLGMPGAVPLALFADHDGAAGLSQHGGRHGSTGTRPDDQHLRAHAERHPQCSPSAGTVASPQTCDQYTKTPIFP